MGCENPQIEDTTTTTTTTTTRTTTTKAKPTTIKKISSSNTGQCKDWSFCATYNPATSCQFIQMYCPMKCCKHFNKCVEMGCENPPVETTTTTTTTTTTKKPATL